MTLVIVYLSLLHCDHIH